MTEKLRNHFKTILSTENIQKPTQNHTFTLDIIETNINQQFRIVQEVLDGLAWTPESEFPGKTKNYNKKGRSCFFVCFFVLRETPILGFKITQNTPKWPCWAGSVGVPGDGHLHGASGQGP